MGRERIYAKEDSILRSKATPRPAPQPKVEVRASDVAVAFKAHYDDMEKWLDRLVRNNENHDHIDTIKFFREEVLKAIMKVIVNS